MGKSAREGCSRCLCLFCAPRPIFPYQLGSVTFSLQILLHSVKFVFWCGSLPPACKLQAWGAQLWVLCMQELACDCSCRAQILQSCGTGRLRGLLRGCINQKTYKFSRWNWCSLLLHPIFQQALHTQALPNGVGLGFTAGDRHWAPGKLLPSPPSRVLRVSAALCLTLSFPTAPCRLPQPLAAREDQDAPAA